MSQRCPVCFRPVPADAFEDHWAKHDVRLPLDRGDTIATLLKTHGSWSEVITWAREEDREGRREARLRVRADLRNAREELARGGASGNLLVPPWWLGDPDYDLNLRWLSRTEDGHAPWESGDPHEEDHEYA